MTLRILNYLGFQVGWFACIGGAASGRPLLGPLVMGALLAVHVGLSREPRRELTLVVSAGILGYAADSALVLSGVLAFAGEGGLGWPCPIWMVGLWMGFAATLHSSMSWMKGRYLLGAAVGAITAPAAYAAGVRAGAAAFGVPVWWALAAVALEWGVAMPVLLWLAALTAPARRQMSS